VHGRGADAHEHLSRSGDGPWDIGQLEHVGMWAVALLDDRSHRCLLRDAAILAQNRPGLP
jgi:hypothetical protein